MSEPRTESGREPDRAAPVPPRALDAEWYFDANVTQRIAATIHEARNHKGGVDELCLSFARGCAEDYMRLAASREAAPVPPDAPRQWWFAAEGPEEEMVCGRCDQRIPNGTPATYVLAHADRCPTQAETGLDAAEIKPVMHPNAYDLDLDGEQ